MSNPEPVEGALREARRIYHWLMIWPCLWIGALYKEENWFSERAGIHWLLSRRAFNE